MTRQVTFDTSCEYDSAAYNADDVNKLFGLSFGFGGVHHNSARFGWRWSKNDQCIELVAYVYNEGKKNWDAQLRYPVVAQVKPGKTVWCHIIYTPAIGDKAGYFCFMVDDPQQRWLETNVIAPDNLPHYGLTHGLYFGGELVASHNMSVQIGRV